ncbi:HlyD family type I secretion periplasmic adaptor subunit [Roseateles chitosanitabidus]|jgi:adhesin transport system membrane fusion protein|uniref:HlyD family type I secretion periplasmic adaptor subunit n=1 Tax=Roseateles chitosanitabidus TaxID=65048 RepID=UPI00083747CC|nr:HlyD family type I secretion periplasmic adaptor subunit [Roseateles chitosanitabidus]MBO9685077.1 HlyD family type I secretion periplasmic adaptor subunit [Roseateles chitosanitabidus]
MSQTRSLSREEGLFVGSVQSALIDEPLPRAVWALYLIGAVLLVGLVWSSIATVDEVTRSDARIVPDGKEQVIASLESGTLGKLLVHEGEEVEAGQPLAELDPTRAEAAENESQAKRLGLMAQVARLRAEALGVPLKFPDEVRKVQRLVDSETEVFDTRRRVLDEAVSSTNRSIGLLASEQKLAQDMASKGLMSNVEVMRVTRQVNELQQQRNERISRFRQDASTELSKAQTDLAQMDEQLVVRRDAVTRSVLKSPVKGLVKNIKMNTVGGVIASGAPIMEIVPIGPRILIEARIKPKDIGYIQVGQTAVIKLNGYDFNVNGGLHAKVEYVSPDALGETEKNNEGTYYRVQLTAERNTLRANGDPLPVIPGMTAMVDIRTGERSVLSYLLRPMLKSREALRER